MNRNTKIFFGIAAAAGLTLVAAKGLRLSNAADKLIMRLSNIGKPKFSLQGLTIPISISLENPTGTTISVVKPVVRVYDISSGQRVLLSSSLPTNEKINIAGHASTQIKDIKATVGSGALVTLLATSVFQLPSIISKLISGQKAGKTLEIETITYMGSLEVTESETISI